MRIFVLLLRSHLTRWNRFNLYSFNLLTLPERQEDDRLDGEEFEHRVERLEHLPRGSEEQEQAVQSERDREVVHDGDVEVATVGAPVAVVVVAGGLEKMKKDL